MGGEADDIITSFGLSEQEMKSYETVRNRFQNQFIAKRNVILERAKFNVRIQDENEVVEDFITHLHCLAKYCEFGVRKDQLIRNRIVVGLKNKKLFEKLQLDPELTLEKAMAQARQSEEIKNNKVLFTCRNTQEVMSTITLTTSTLTTNFHIFVSRGAGWLGISRTIKF